MQDHPRPLRDHAPRRRPRGQEVAAQAGDRRAQHVVGGHLDQRRALQVAAADQVERHVDAAGPCDDIVDVRVDRGLLQRIDDRHVRGATRRLDVLGDRRDGLAGPACQEHLGPVPRERARHGAANAPTPAVDDHVPTFQQPAHVPSILGSTSVHRATPTRRGSHRSADDLRRAEPDSASTCCGPTTHGVTSIRTLAGAGLSCSGTA